jgi:hypothetical protein
MKLEKFLRKEPTTRMLSPALRSFFDDKIRGLGIGSREVSLLNPHMVTKYNLEADILINNVSVVRVTDGYPEMTLDFICQRTKNKDEKYRYVTWKVKGVTELDTAIGWLQGLPEEIRLLSPDDWIPKDYLYLHIKAENVFCEQLFEHLKRYLLGE